MSRKGSNLQSISGEPELLIMGAQQHDLILQQERVELVFKIRDYIIMRRVGIITSTLSF